MSLEHTTRKACVACGAEYEGVENTVCPQDGALLAPVNEQTLIGTVLGDRYEVLELIGEGGMGIVYRGRHKLMKRIVAIKMLHANLVSSPAALLRFQQEAEAASALNHPHILTVYDFGVSPDGKPYLVMDFLEGTSLAQLIEKNGSLPAERCVPIFIQACAGLAHAHQKGVIHRDIKPANIMLVNLDGNPDYVKIVDFGIAKLMPQADEESRHLTQTGQVFGSPLYMSPEQCRAGELDARTDIYSMGCVIYRTLTGKAPVAGKDMLDCMYKQVHDMPPDFADACPDLQFPPGLEPVVFKCMAKEPEQRFSSMTELRDALDAAMKPMPAVRLSGQQTATVILNDSQAKAAPAAPPAQPQLSANLPAPAAKAPSLQADDSSTTVPALQHPGLQLGKSGMALNQNAMAVLVSLAVLAVAGGFLMMIPHADQKKEIGAQQQTASPPAKSSTPEPAGTSPQTVPAIATAVATTAPIVPMTPAFDQYYKTAQAAYSKGNLSVADDQIKLALREASTVAKPDVKRVATLVNMLGKIRYLKGKYEEAKVDFQMALMSEKKNFGEQSLDVADTMVSLGRCFMALGENGEAQPLVDGALSIIQQAPQAKPLELADALSGVGELAMRQGRYREAIDYLNQALVIRKEQEGDNSADVAISYSNLAQAYELDRQYDKAFEKYTQALAIWQKNGNNSVAVADTLTCLGSLCAGKGQYAEAQGFYKRALTIQKASVGPGSPSMQRTQQLYAQLQNRMGKGRRR